MLVILALFFILLIMSAIFIGAAWTSLMVSLFSLGAWYWDVAIRQRPVESFTPKPTSDNLVKEIQEQVKELYEGTTQENSEPGDDRIANKMLALGSQAQEAILKQTRMTSENSKKYYEEELHEQEHRHWWEADY